MGLLDIALCLAALGALCAWLSAAAGLAASLAPLAGLSLILPVLLGGGMLGCLPAACAAIYLLCAGCGVHAAWLCFGPQKRRVRAETGAVLFWGCAAALGIYFSVLQPDFLNFDEYSFWGLAAKLTGTTGVLFTEAKTGLPWQMTQFAALPLTSCFAQFFGFGTFAPWKAIWAADVLMLAGIGTVTGCAEGAGRRVGVPLGVAALLSLTFLSVYSHTALLHTAWLEFLGDAPAGVLFGAAAAFWFAVRRGPRRLRWLVLPVLCLAANIKSNTFVLGLAAAGIAAADCLFFAPQAEEQAPGTGIGAIDTRPAKKTGAAVLRRAAFALTCVAAPCVQYLLWNRYTAALVRQNAAAGGTGETSEALPTVVKNGLVLLLGGTPAPYYEQRRAQYEAYADALRALYFTHPVSMVGSGAAVTALILALCAAAALLAPARRDKLRIALAAGCGTVCFVLYQWVLLLSYAFVLKDSSPENPASYSRYIQSYYIGWFLLALGLFGLAGAKAVRQKRGAGGTAARAAALALAAGMTFGVLTLTEPQFTVLGVSRGEYAALRAEQTTAAWALDTAEGDAPVFFLVAQGDDGGAWFRYHTALLPGVLAYGVGGGTYGLPALENGDAYYAAFSAAEFQGLVNESGAQYLLIAQEDTVFRESYAALFADGLALAQSGQPCLYRIDKDAWTPVAAQTAGGAE